MEQIALTKGKVALVDEEDFEHLNQFKWYYSSCGYAQRDIGGRKNKRKIKMHRIIKGVNDDAFVDHVNRDKLDNRKSNLRLCDLKQNNRNTAPHKNSSSKYKGVYRDKSRDKWAVQIMVDRKKKCLGRFDSEKEAAQAYNDAAKEFFGEFAYLNEIQGD